MFKKVTVVFFAAFSLFAHVHPMEENFGEDFNLIDEFKYTDESCTQTHFYDPETNQWMKINSEDRELLEKKDNKTITEKAVLFAREHKVAVILSVAALATGIIAIAYKKFKKNIHDNHTAINSLKLKHETLRKEILEQFGLTTWDESTIKNGAQYYPKIQFNLEEMQNIEAKIAALEKKK